MALQEHLVKTVLRELVELQVHQEPQEHLVQVVLQVQMVHQELVELQVHQEHLV